MPPRCAPAAPPRWFLERVTRAPLRRLLWRRSLQWAEIRGSGGNPLGLWPHQSRQLPHRVPGGEGQLPSVGVYIQIFMVGRKPGGTQRPLPGGRARGCGGGHQGPSACPESTHSQWHWLTSICAWEFPAQGWSQAQTLELDQGHSGKCSPLGVTRACQDFRGPLDKERPRKTREQGAYPEPNPRVEA